MLFNFHDPKQAVIKMKKLLPFVMLTLSACSSQISLPESCEQFINEYSKLSAQDRKQIPNNLFGGELLNEYPTAGRWTLKSKYRDLLNNSYRQIEQQAGTKAADVALKSFESSCSIGMTKVRIINAGKE